ncbi:thioredoxin, mitochondrial [Episyrphus balteatus]|uniref:thioredoxin, mitochondrial n=1 Tax=Episyrphus balteatus TaxID=286459 RepID=UPI0024855C2F|nr:thioredoxin, mitochondrial [Episyrphus balteatus]XP_055857367.1 thioredoxin, mitochondrial [Episyrphus balteatus]XP_055857368.1 thioredoxin, mitochondrial [Episyrphus balteatus]
MMNQWTRILTTQSYYSRRFFSKTLNYYKSFVIKDHYDFDRKVINSDNPVIVNFHAEWCDPCKILTPKMTELLENSDEIDLAVIDVESNTDLVETFEVKAVPAVLAFRNGVVVDKFIGLVDANIIETLIQKLKPTKKEK